MFQVAWSSVVHVLWCYPGSVVYNSPTLSLLVPGLLSLPELLRLSLLQSFNVNFKVYMFDSFSVTLTEVFFSVGLVISMNRQLLHVCSWLKCLICWLYLTICLHWHISQDCDIVFFCYCLGLIPFCLYSFLFLQLATWIMFPIFANIRAFLDIS